MKNEGQIQAPIQNRKNARWVSDGLEDDFKDWHHQDPVLISAQTGTGKNHFIMEKLIPYAVANKKYVFLFSNRSALNIQQKRLLLRKLHMPDIYKDKELNAKTDFGFVSVINYQSALSFLTSTKHGNSVSEIIRSGYYSGYVIFDEAHFFLSDALFNADTERIYQCLLSTFSSFVRIYMTATPDDIKGIINYSEMENQQSSYVTYADMGNRSYSNKPSKSLLFYEFPRSYSDYNIMFFTSIEQLYENMRQADSKDKWLCFINSKSKQTTISKELKDGGNVAVECFDRTKRKDDKLWEPLVKGMIPGDVLLTTIALDNGINLTDPALCNIVVDSADKVSLLQMIGRKRRKEGEKVNLYVHVPSEAEVERLLRDIRDMLSFVEEYRKYREYPGFFLQLRWSDFHQKYRNLFYINDQYQLVHNTFASIELRGLYLFYSELLHQMQLQENRYEKYIIFPQMVMEWLGISQPIQWVDAEKVEAAIKDLCTLLEKKLPIGIPNEEHKTFFDEFKRYADIIKNGKGVLRSDSRSGPKIMSDFLEEQKKDLGALYKIQGKGEWRVSKEEL